MKQNCELTKRVKYTVCKKTSNGRKNYRVRCYTKPQTMRCNQRKYLKVSKKQESAANKIQSLSKIRMANIKKTLKSKTLTRPRKSNRSTLRSRNSKRSGVRTRSQTRRVETRSQKRLRQSKRR